MKPALVYFLRPVGMDGPIKIGCSNMPQNRLIAYQAWTPWPIEIMGVVPGGYPDESFLHKCFAASHQHCEWFKATPHVVENIRKILDAGSIDAVRGVLSPVGSIKAKNKRVRTENDRQRTSYKMRVMHCERRLRKTSKTWHAPADVSDIISQWGGYTYWSRTIKEFVTVIPSIPSEDQIARLDEYLANPSDHSILPSWEVKTFKDPICIPVFLTEEIAA